MFASLRNAIHAFMYDDEPAGLGSMDLINPATGLPMDGNSMIDASGMPFGCSASDDDMFSSMSFDSFDCGCGFD